MAETHEPSWRALIGAGLVAKDVSVAAIARYGQVSPHEASAALIAARAAEALDDQGRVADDEAVRLVADLPIERVAEIHARVARQCLAGGPDRFDEALEHARAAGTLMPLDDLVHDVDEAGRLSLSLRAYQTAHDLLLLAVEADVSSDATTRALRLCDLAAAADGLGDVAGARRWLAEAMSLAERSGNTALAAHAAVHFALPADWYAGDPRSAALLERAAALPLSDDDRIAVSAARALVEMRIPIDTDGQQTAWVTRPDVGQPLAQTALDGADGCRPDVRLLALLAWRGTHRAPRFLDRRRALSREALNLSQQLRSPSQQVDAGVWCAVDALESGDRPEFDHALAVVRWVAERDGNPRLRWRACTLAAGAAHLDGDLDQGIAYAEQAAAIGRSISTPGWVGAQLLFSAQSLLDRDDEAGMTAALAASASLPMSSPLATALVAHLEARIGDPVNAERHVRFSLRKLDPEASYLFLATHLAATVALLPAGELTRQLVDVLLPWEHHIAVDSNAWWCNGPVSLVLARLRHQLGEHQAARRHLDHALTVARAMNDVRSLERGARLLELIQSSTTQGPVELTARESKIVRMMAEGASNAQIAAALTYSLATIKGDITSINRKLGARNRGEAVAAAQRRGLIPAVPAE